jgi:LPXTG-motif cell wall-anchored protein
MSLEATQTIWGDGIPVAWESTDTVIFDLIAGRSTAPAANSASSMPTTSASPSRESSAPTVPPDSDGPASSLSTGAKAGIGVSASIAGLLLMALLTVLVRRRKKKRDQHLEPMLEVGHVPADMYRMRAEQQSLINELPADPMEVHELPGGRAVDTGKLAGV